MLYMEIFMSHNSQIITAYSKEKLVADCSPDAIATVRKRANTKGVQGRLFQGQLH